MNVARCMSCRIESTRVLPGSLYLAGRNEAATVCFKSESEVTKHRPFDCPPCTSNAPVLHQKRSHQSECRKLNDSKIFSPARKGLVAGSSPAEPTLITGLPTFLKIDDLYCLSTPKVARAGNTSEGIRSSQTGIHRHKILHDILRPYLRKRLPSPTHHRCGRALGRLARRRSRRDRQPSVT